ncbi:TonB-linked SusC/RagA family outer membrane protein [Chitinophaga niastensis]|uniref:TonB-linked SusC/RagA family outer membrane protein n=1 Tax=Chitinophaga niastensis TaxID=536980 RepID=A0A2P8HDT8_CHINA|nr:SusC/RagA family TonB-linked outer membrane protein [Chitinophaga niastensis]PSL44379.1 TonB-linked SusC/RagA family outer membrane protein [Chitinophaga niastensis]
MTTLYTHAFRGALLMLLLATALSVPYAYGQEKTVSRSNTADTTLPVNGTPIVPESPIHGTVMPGAISVMDASPVKLLPYSSIDQLLQARISGVEVRNTTGEPGIPGLTIIRGTAIPLNGAKSSYYAQPLYVVDGVPLVMEHPYAFDIKQYDYTRPGPNINMAAAIDINNIESIEVLKDFGATAMYGPRGVNGVIRITTRKPQAGKQKVSINTYFGVTAKPFVHTINAAFERDFRLPFYNKYANAGQWAAFPRYLADSMQPAYYGPSNWDDTYYQNRMVQGVSAAINGGGPRSNFIFGLGEQHDPGIADKSGLNKYNVYFKLNIEPVKNMQVLTSISGTLMDRKNNHSLRDRFAEEEYLPSLTDPLPPNKDYLSKYITEYDRVVDKNKSNAIQASLSVNYNFIPHFTFTSLLAIDYNDQNRDYFIPGSINEGNSYISYYTGLNRRITVDNAIAYTNNFSAKHTISLKLGQSVQLDSRKYDYTKGYRGPSDFIKIIRAGDKVTPENNTYDARMVYSYKDYINFNLVSFYGSATYDFNNKLNLSMLLRSDGSSNINANGYTWFVSPTIAASYKLSEENFLRNSSTISRLLLRASWGREGRLFLDDNIGNGPYYTVDIGWSGNRNIAGYNGIPTLGLPFGKGYSGWGTRWPYTDQWNLGADLSLWHDKIAISGDIYSKTDKNGVIAVPVPSEYGFKQTNKNGMSVRNYGAELSIAATVSNGAFSWQPQLIMQTNQNKLLALPDNLSSITYGNRRLKVGKPIDRYWLLQNNGIYTKESDIPVKNGQPLSFNGIPFKVGDPKWEDMTGDNVINDDDRIMKGHINPAISGGFSNTFTYKQLSLNVVMAYSLGRQVINARMAGRFDFVNREGVDNINGVKELTFWQRVGDYSKYPMYNPWSYVNPYQADQTLFLEDASFAKLRSLTLSYSLTGMKWARKRSFTQCKVYATVNNLFTITRYSGADPELADFTGYDNGYGMPIPKTYTLGFTLEF